MVAFNRIRVLITITKVLTVISSVSCPTQRPTWKLFKKLYIDSVSSQSSSVTLGVQRFYIRNINEVLYPRHNKVLKKTCIEWILFYNFKSNNANENWLTAIMRDMRNDRNMHDWASGYAQWLDLSKLNEAITPAQYCVEKENALKKTLFISKREEKRKSCENWILSAHYLSENVSFNMNKAVYRNKNEDGFINECVAGYGQFLSSLGFNRVTDGLNPAKYCLRRLENLYLLLDHWILNEVRKPCYEWILHYGYTFDDIDLNLYLAVNRDKSNDNDSSIWATAYGIHLEKHLNNDNELVLPSLFCFNYYGKNEEDDVPFQKYRIKE